MELRMAVTKAVRFILWGVLLVSAERDWTSQCSTCKCVWSNGKKSADCRTAQLSDIPMDLSPELRDIDFSNNALYELKPRVFEDANLVDVHKLKLQNCSIQAIQTTSFNALENLIELDLSDNAITRLDRSVFHNNFRLRILFMRNNRIKTLDDGLFGNQTFLQKVDFAQNLLEAVSADAFRVTPNLRHISLANNQIRHMDHEFITNFNRLSSLALEGNPWVCDCKLQKFRNESIHRNLINSVTCNEPERLRDKSWKDESAIFACGPRILEPSQYMRFDVTTINFTMTCGVEGNPKPDIDWIFNGRIIDSDPRLSTQKYETQEYQKTDSFYLYNMTIINVNYRDKGDYRCVAKNPGGVQERNFTLAVMGSEYAGGGGGGGGGGVGGRSQFGKDMPLIVGLTVGAILLLILIIILIMCCCKRSNNASNSSGHFGKSHSMNHQLDEMHCMDGVSEMEKALITNVNPVVKPPRQYSVPPSETSRGTEVSETKKMLDNDSIFACDDDSRSFDFDSRLALKSQNFPDNYRGDHHPYPPDLLPFPPRGLSQVSPAGSSASTVADTSRLPAHHGPQSPIHSPLYETSSIYRTLPYSRSHSPFTSSPMGPPVRGSRQGYVTIPRRPRQSWSSEPAAPPLTNDLGEPLYDNLGLRTTASGNSVLSLNKLGESSAPSTPRARGLYSLTPTITDPIAEHETSAAANTLPRSTAMAMQKSCSPPSIETMRGHWTRSPDQSDSRRESTASLIPSSEGVGKTPKVPPRPPPKPKKRASTGPLFEDEGEDGTEV